MRGVILDISKQKNIEGVLKTREEHLRSVLEIVPDAMIVIDDRGIIRSFSTSANRLFGFTASETIGQNVSMLMPEPDRSRHDSYVARYRDTREARVIGVGPVVTGQRQDGSTFPMRLSLSKLALASVVVSPVSLDLTERQETPKNFKSCSLNSRTCRASQRWVKWPQHSRTNSTNRLRPSATISTAVANFLGWPGSDHVEDPRGLGPGGQAGCARGLDHQTLARLCRAGGN